MRCHVEGINCVRFETLTAVNRQMPVFRDVRIKAESSFKMLVPCYQITHCHVMEYGSLQVIIFYVSKGCMNFISNIEPFCHTFWRYDVPLTVMTSGMVRGIAWQRTKGSKPNPLKCSFLHIVHFCSGPHRLAFLIVFISVN